jgi:hypothetical protein
MLARKCALVDGRTHLSHDILEEAEVVDRGQAWPEHFTGAEEVMNVGGREIRAPGQGELPHRHRVLESLGLRSPRVERRWCELCLGAIAERERHHDDVRLRRSGVAVLHRRRFERALYERGHGVRAAKGRLRLAHPDSSVAQGRSVASRAIRPRCGGGCARSTRMPADLAPGARSTGPHRAYPGPPLRRTAVWRCPRWSGSRSPRRSPTGSQGTAPPSAPSRAADPSACPAEGRRSATPGWAGSVVRMWSGPGRSRTMDPREWGLSGLDRRVPRG